MVDDARDIFSIDLKGKKLKRRKRLAERDLEREREMTGKGRQKTCNVNERKVEKCRNFLVLEIPCQRTFCCLSLLSYSLPSSPTFYSLIVIDSRSEEFAFQFNSPSSYSVLFVDSSLSLKVISDDRC